jgi:excisionase family DNA binding protein
MTAPKLLLRPEEAAEVLGIGRSKLYELLAVGEVESVRIGKCRRVPLAALDDYVRRLRSGGENTCDTQDLGVA